MHLKTFLRTTGEKPWWFPRKMAFEKLHTTTSYKANKLDKLEYLKVKNICASKD